MTETFFNDLALELYNNFFNPQKRLFLGYLGCALIIALAWLTFIKRFSLKSAWQKCCSKQIWWSVSSRADYKLFIINKILFTALAPALLAKLTVATALFHGLQSSLGYRPLIILQDWQVAASFTLFLLLLDDFARFYLHRLMHLSPALWAFHKVHHSARTMTPMTVLRTHPVEGILFSLRSALVQGTSIALFVFIFANQVNLLSILGANAFVFFFNVLGSNLRHSHISISYFHWLEKWLISPAQHQIHHSTETRHFDKNFGAILAIWDRLSGSLHPSEKDTELHFGLSKTEQPDEHSLISLYLTPCSESLSHIRERINTLLTKPLTQRK